MEFLIRFFSFQKFNNKQNLYRSRYRRKDDYVVFFLQVEPEIVVIQS